MFLFSVSSAPSAARFVSHARSSRLSPPTCVAGCKRERAPRRPPELFLVGIWRFICSSGRQTCRTNKQTAVGGVEQEARFVSRIYLRLEQLFTHFAVVLALSKFMQSVGLEFILQEEV
jgi:hypothetical protein